MIIVALVVFGLCLGSFVNALVWRLHAQTALRSKQRPTKADLQQVKKLSIANGRSVCMSCGHKLEVKDLIPVVSWIMLRGRCRYCNSKIPDTPIAELLVPVLFVVSYTWWPYVLTGVGHIALFVVWLACLVLFVALALYDLWWYLLPDRLVASLVISALAFRCLIASIAPGGHVTVLLGGLWGVLLLAGLFYLLFTVSQERWIGGGDVKLAVALGLLAGGPLNSLFLLFTASAGGTVVSLPLLVAGRSWRGVRIPFGPFLLAATVVAVLFGPSVTGWYSGLFQQ
jgi:leader peptidase (prepilin peptidase)/N-methyltransferase